jgi:putative membrane protein
MFYFEKGSGFYFSNTFFWLKIGIFAFVGLISIYPTMRFLKWKKFIESGKDIELGAREYSRIKLYLNMEVASLVLMLMPASLMAKSINF